MLKERSEPVRKRGPPKGFVKFYNSCNITISNVDHRYMGAMEQRLSNAEALLGTLICSNDPRVAAIISDISKDTFASSILTRIKEGQYGIRGRLAREQMESASLDGSQYTFLPPQLSLNSTGEPLSSKLDKGEYDLSSSEVLDIHDGFSYSVQCTQPRMARLSTTSPRVGRKGQRFLSL